jgi:ABC-type multidrug transport system fused ATPase/permease subunit
MAQNRRKSFGESVDPADKKELNKENLQKALSIFRFIKPYQGTFVVGMLFLILSNLTTLSFPTLIGEMAKVIEGKSTYTINEVTAFFIVILIAQSIFSFLRIYTFSQVSEQAMRDVRKSLYTKMITLPVFFFEKRRVGELMSRITSDITQLQDVLSITLAEFFRQIFTLVGGITIISLVSWKLTLFMLGTFPVLIVAAMIFGKFIRKISKKVQDELATTNILVEETLQSINVVKAFTNEQYESNRYGDALNRVLKDALKTATYRGAFVSFIIFALFGAIVGVVWFLFYTAFIGGSVGGLGDMYAQLQKTMGASERVLEILDEDSEVNLDQTTNLRTLPASVALGIDFEHITFSYPSRPDIQVLKDVSISIKPGEKIALVGPSGTGKSTIVQLLMRYYEPSSGQVLVNNQNITGFDVSDFRRNIAIVPQEVMLFGGSIYENIAYGKPNASRAEIIEAARKANALEFIESFPEKYETLVGERGVKLSGGQRQRIAIARAILKDPRILILDEATSALDSESEKLVQDALDGLMLNRTTIIIAHRLATIRNVDNIYVIKDGSIAESGSHDQLLAQENGIYANLVKLQFDLSEN